MKKFNWLDVTIVLVILAIVAVGVLFMNRKKEETATVETKTMEFAVELREVPMSICEEYEKIIGQKIVIGVSNIDEGTVTDVLWKKSEKITKDVVEGNFYIADTPDIYDVIITVEFEGIETPERISSGNEDISVGYEMVFHGKGFAGQGFVIGLRTEVPK